MKKIHSISILFILFISCTNNSEVENRLLKPLYALPETVPLNTDTGYSHNTVSGDSIEPIINSIGQRVITGKPILFQGREVLESEVPKSVVMPAGKPIITVAQSTTVGYLKAVTRKVDESKLKKGKLGEGDQDFILTNSLGDTIPTGVPIPAIGIVTKVVEKAPTRALPPRMKDNSIYDIQYLDKEQGMSNSSTMVSIYDSHGFLWTANRYGGISKYDGRNFYHYSTNEGFPFNGVTSMMEDSKNRIWVGTLEGIVCFNGTEFISFSEKNGLIKGFKWSIMEDRKGNIWIVNGGKTLVKFDGKSFVYYTQNEGLVLNAALSKILEDSNGNLWIGNNKGLIKFDGVSFTQFGEEFGFLQNYPAGIGNLAYTSENEMESLWMTIPTKGVLKYTLPKNGSIGTLTSFSNDNTDIWRFNNSILIAEDRNVWINTGFGGVLSFKPELSKNAVIPLNLLTVNEGLPHNELWGSVEDSHHRLNFGSDGGGAIFYNPKSFIDFTALEGLKTNEIRAITRDKEGNIWFGTDGRGITKYNPETKTFYQYTTEQGLPTDDIWSLHMDSSGNLWIGSWQHGVTKFDGKIFTHFSPKQGIPNTIVTSIDEDKSGNIFFGGNDGDGLVRYGPSKNVEGMMSFTHFTDQEGLLNSNVFSFLQDRKGNYWIGNEGGVGKWDGIHLTNYSEREGLAGKLVNAILEDKSGNIWFGTDQGLDKFDGHSFTHYNKKTGLSSNEITSIVEDESGNLWVGTSNGLNRLDFGHKPLGQSMSKEGTLPSNAVSVYVYGYSDGLKETNFMRNAALIDENNQAWWGTEKNLVMLDLANYSTATEPPTVHLTQIDLNNQFIDYYNIPSNLTKLVSFSDVEKFNNIPKDLELNSKVNHLSFSFVGIDWAAPQKIKYSYKLEGLSGDWSDPSIDIKADFRNLSYGNYRFLVRAIGESIEWSQPVSYSFIILPPWWHTWWAYVLYLVLGLGLLRAYVVFRSRNLVRENKILEEKVSHRTNQLERSLDNLKSTQAQLIQSEKMASLGELTAGIAHEIQNPLNFVNNFSEVSEELIEEVLGERLKVKGERDEALEGEILGDIKENLTKIHHHGNRASSIVKGMLEHSRTSSGEKELTDINALADEYLRLSYHGLNAKNKDFNAEMVTNFDPNLPKIEVVSQDIGRVFLNLINNAFQAVQEEAARRKAQGDLEYKPMVTIKTELTAEGRVQIAITDNGPGIPDEIKNKIFQPFFTTKSTGKGTGLGLSLAYDIITKGQGGTLDVISKEGKGATFFVKLSI